MYCNLCIGYIYPHGGEEEDRAVLKSRTSQKNEQSELSFLLSPSLQLRDILIDLTLRPTDSATVVAQYIYLFHRPINLCHRIGNDQFTVKCDS